MRNSIDRRVRISVPLKNWGKDFISVDELENENIVVYYFDNEEKFQKYITSDFIKKISDKCNSPFLDEYEMDTISYEYLLDAIQIIDNEIKSKKNLSILEYLEKTKELMLLALEKKTFIQFDL